MQKAVLGVILGLATFLAVSFVAKAAQPFDAKGFQEAQAAGQTILIHVTAPWCPTCRLQHPIVQSIEKERPALLVYDVDFDSGKEILKQFRVQYQSTFVLFKGAKEVGRSTGETNPDRIRAFVAQGF
ncbi:MAG: thioredoxin family protein [Xanthobacteraceae bacterium]